MGSNIPVPTGMHTPETAHHIIFAIVAVSLAGLFVYSFFEWRRTGKPLMTLLILGGALCCLNESLVDILGRCYFPTDGWMGQTLLGRSVPVWVDITYAIFFGAFPYFLYLLLKRGTSRRAMWLAIVTFWVANMILELPLLGSNLYVYYGVQPFKVGGFPLFWLTINVLGALSAAVVVTCTERFLTGPRLLLVVLVPFACYMASWVVDMPGFWALNSNASNAVKWAAVGLSVALGVLAIDTLIRIGRAFASAPAPLEREPAPLTAAPSGRELQTA
jgi:hypothetical protein